MASQIYGDPGEYQKTREETLYYIISHNRKFSVFDTDIDWRLSEQRVNRTWGGSLELAGMSELYKVGIKVWELSSSGELVARFDNTDVAATKGLQVLNLVRHRGVHYDSVILGNQEVISGAVCLPKVVLHDTSVLNEISPTTSSFRKQRSTSTAESANLESFSSRSHGTLMKNMDSNVEKDHNNRSVLSMDILTFDKLQHPMVFTETSVKDLTKTPLSDTNLNGSTSGSSFNACPCTSNTSGIRSALIPSDNEPTFGRHSLRCRLAGRGSRIPESNTQNRSRLSVAKLTDDRKECNSMTTIDVLPLQIEEPDESSNLGGNVPLAIEDSIIIDWECIGVNGSSMQNLT